MWDDFAEYILSETENKNVKIAEIAVGKFDRIADYLASKDNIDLIKTDIAPKDETVIKDDITNPNMDLYKDRDIIYSIRPPSELQPPLTNEDLNTGNAKMKLKNFKKASFYTLR